MDKGFTPFDFLVDKGARFACEGDRFSMRHEGDVLTVSYKRVPLLQVERLDDGRGCWLRLFPAGDGAPRYELAAILRLLGMPAYDLIDTAGITQLKFVVAADTLRVLSKGNALGEGVAMVPGTEIMWYADTGEYCCESHPWPGKERVWAMPDKVYTGLLAAIEELAPRVIGAAAFTQRELRSVSTVAPLIARTAIGEPASQEDIVKAASVLGRHSNEYVNAGLLHAQLSSLVPQVFYVLSGWGYLEQVTLSADRVADLVTRQRYLVRRPDGALWSKEMRL